MLDDKKDLLLISCIKVGQLFRFEHALMENYHPKIDKKHPLFNKKGTLILKDRIQFHKT